MTFSTDVETGTVRQLHPEKGFGFIHTPAGDDYFFHRDSCQDFARLHVGAMVTFRPTTNARGPRAEDVR